MFTTYDRPEPSGAVAPGAELSAPRGRKGLWGALAHASAPSVGARSLPVTDLRLAVVSTSMFDYDPNLASAIGVEFDLERITVEDFTTD